MSSKPTLTKKEALIRLQKYCVYQDRCHKEVRQKMYDLGVYAEEQDDIIVELISEKFLDEERFARSFARGKSNYKYWGRLKIKRELKQRDVSEYCIKAGLSEIDEAEYRAILKKLLEKKMREFMQLEDFFLRKKCVEFAYGKGYELELIWEVVFELLPK